MHHDEAKSDFVPYIRAYYFVQLGKGIPHLFQHRHVSHAYGKRRKHTIISNLLETFHQKAHPYRAWETSSTVLP